MTAPLALAWHITKKDLRASRDLVSVGVLLTILETLLRTVWPPLTMSLDPDLTEAASQIRSVLPPIRSLMFAMLVAQLVHADPLVGAESFWLTRPISRGTLFVSKLGTMLLAIMLPTFLAQVAPMIAFGVPPLDVMGLVSEYLLYLAAGAMVVFAGAALTPNGRSLVLWVAALGILWAVVTILTGVPGVNRTAASGAMTTYASRWSVPPSAGQVVTVFALMAMGCGVTAWHQFRTRRTGRSTLIAAATAAIVIVMPYGFEPAGLRARSLLTDDPAVPLGSGMRYHAGPRSIVMWPLGERAGRCGVMMRVTQAQGFFQPANAPFWLSYRFVHRPTGRPLAFTYFALPDRTRELDGSQIIVDSEARERFQILYRYAVVGPLSTSDDPRTAELKSVSCRDVDVIVRH